jgi:hypothetical protein
MEECFATCTWMNDNYEWNIIMDDKNKMDEKQKWKNKIKWMKSLNGWTQLVHNQELCVIVNSTSLQLSGLCQ